MSRLRAESAVAEARAVPALLNPSIEGSECLGGVAITATEVRCDYLTLTRARSRPRLSRRRLRPRGGRSGIKARTTARSVDEIFVPNGPGVTHAPGWLPSLAAPRSLRACLSNKLAVTR